VSPFYSSDERQRARIDNRPRYFLRTGDTTITPIRITLRAQFTHLGT
jgi:hypothetical protein